MTYSPWRKALLILSSCSLAHHAKEQHLKYDDDSMEVYELTFDDQTISIADVQKIVWFSPNLQFDIKGAPFAMHGSWVATRAGVQAIDKGPLLPWLEVCNPGYAACYHPILNASFLRNANLNLTKGKQEIEELRRMSVPAALEPVKQHFLENMEFQLALHQSRYNYLKSGDVQQLRKLLCDQCPCGQQEDTLIHSLKTALTGATKLARSNDWYNEVWQCRNPKSKYPLEAWQQFLTQFGIQEKYRFRHVE
jgi:hypothetical protein